MTVERRDRDVLQPFGDLLGCRVAVYLEVLHYPQPDGIGKDVGELHFTPLLVLILLSIMITIVYTVFQTDRRQQMAKSDKRKDRLGSYESNI
jgi:hypothetical protein